MELRWTIFAFTGLLAVATTAQADVLTAPALAHAEAEAVVSSSAAGTILSLPFEVGDRFSKGDILSRLDCSVQQAQATALKAKYEAASLQSDTLERLKNRGGAGKMEAAVALANAEAAKAEWSSAELRIEQCTIVAPFDGRISEYMVNAHEYVQPAQKMFSIVSSGKPDLEIIAPDSWLLWIEPGDIGKVDLAATAGSFDITITGVSPVVDPVSRTVKLTAEFQSDASRVMPGMAGLAQFESSQ